MVGGFERKRVVGLKSMRVGDEKIVNTKWRIHCQIAYDLVPIAYQITLLILLLLLSFALLKFTTSTS